MSKNDDEVLVRVEGVSKKFCRSLKKSLWYGVCDIAGELLPGRKRESQRTDSGLLRADGTTKHTNKHENLTTDGSDGHNQAPGQVCGRLPQGSPMGETSGNERVKYGTAGGNQRADSAEFLEGHSQAGLQMDSEKLASIRSANTSSASGERSSLDSGLSTPPSSVLIRDIRGKKSSSALDSTHGLRAGEFYAVKDVSFELRRGECLGLIGHNGAGKTTLLKMLNGLIKPDSGSITMRGRVGALIALGAGFNPILTGRENIYINGSVLGLTKKEIDAKIDEIIDFAEIREAIDMPVQNYSSGMNVRLGFAVATTLEPDVLILDEVLAVGDMAFQAKCLKRIGKLRENGVAMIFVSHNFHQMSMACDTGLVLEKGEKLIKDDIKKALDFYEIKTRKKSKISSGESKWSSKNVDINLNHISDSFQEKDESIISPNTPFSIIFDVFSRYLENHGIILDTRIEDSLGTLTQFSSAEKNIILPPGKSVIQIDYSGIATHGESLRFNFAIWSKHEKCIIAWSKGHKIYVEKKSGVGGREACNVSFRLN